MQLFEHQTAALKATEDLNRVAIPGYAGLYEIDTQGNVYSLLQAKSRRKRILKAYPNGNGYMKVNLYDVDGKCKKKYIHRLVAAAFIPNPNNYSEVNHIDCDKTNNHVDNLEWCDRKTNLKHSYEHGLKRCGEKHGCHKITRDAVHDIRKQELSQKEYALKYRIAQCTVSAIQHGRIWKEGDL